MLLAAACGGTAAPTPSPTSFTVSAAQADEYQTAYIAEVVAPPEGGDLTEGAGEHVVLRNNADIRIDMGGWTVKAEDGLQLPVGIGRQIDVGAELRVHTSCGEDSEDAVFACLGDEALNDEAGLVMLLDAAGTEVARLEYGRP